MTMTAEAPATRKAGPVLPFDAAKLDRLLDAEGIDAIVVCSKHNIQYLLGGYYRFFFFAYMDAMGPSRYLPLLVYRKGLRRDAEEYTATTPPHVAAARKSLQPLGRTISYVMTTAGAEPIDNIQNPVDREHYVIKQVKPVAEPVLATLRLDFEKVIGDARQLDLLG